MKPDKAAAERVLEQALVGWSNASKYQIAEAIEKALSHLRGYELPVEILAKYVCSQCGAKGVKLWRPIHTASEAWCAKCGMAQAGYPDVIDADGRHDAGDYGPSDQIYNSKQGINLLPWVPAPDGQTWGYTSIPPEGCLWWRTLPTRETSSVRGVDLP